MLNWLSVRKRLCSASLSSPSPTQTQTWQKRRQTNERAEIYRGAMKCCLIDMPCHAVSEPPAVVATCTVQPASQNARRDGGCLHKAFPLNKELLATVCCWEIRMNSCFLVFPLVGSTCVSGQPHIHALIELSEKGRGGVVSSNSSSMQWKGDMVKGMEGRK